MRKPLGEFTLNEIAQECAKHRAETNCMDSCPFCYVCVDIFYESDCPSSKYLCANFEEIIEIREE